MLLSLEQVFGERAIQSSDRLEIDKRDFIDLSAASNKTGESLLVSILLNVRKNFEGNIEDQLGNSLTDQYDRSVTFNNSALYELINIFYWKRQFLIKNAQPTIVDTFIVESNAVK